MSTSTGNSQSKAQAAEVSYELHSLGWKAFQNLCVTITADLWGQTVQSFFDSHDAGRDGAFQGKWQSTEGETFEGSFTAQCKFTAKGDLQIELGDLKDELKKAKRLAERGLSDNYFLFTNYRITGSNEMKIQDAFLKVPGIKAFKAYGSERISGMIRESPRLRMLVPRVYGLGDLSQILDQRACDQAREILTALGDDLAKFVITDAFQRSARALLEHGFVLLLGEPACGKSTIAAALAVGALDNWGCSTFKVRNAEELIAHSNPHEPRQFFWVDDAFGATQFDSSSVAAWNTAFPHLHAAIKRGARVLFTSRDYIYNAALHHLKQSAFPVIKESQVVIHVEKLSKEEKEQILYNHIRLGNQPSEFKAKLKPFLPDVAAHPRFSPEIARRLGDKLFTKGLHVSKDSIQNFVSNPVELLCEIVRTIDPNSRSALALVFMRGGQLGSPIEMTEEEQAAIERIGGAVAGVGNSLNALNGSLVLQNLHNSAYSWRFKHPTVRDALASVIGDDRELMDIYLSGAPVDRLFGEVTCGEVGVQGAKVIIPQDRYGLMLSRLGKFDFSKSEDKRKLHHFLAYRCDREFLVQFIAKYSGFISDLRVGSYLYAVSDVDVIVRLHELGLLPEAKRLQVVSAIRELAVDTPDAGFLREEIRELHTPAEFEATLEDVKLKLLPNLTATIESWRDNFYHNQEEPESYFDPLVSALKEFQEELTAHTESTEQIQAALADIKETVMDLMAEAPEPDYDDDYRGGSSGSDDDSRSIFDDVDH
jgi:hypothetical protein